MDEMYNFFTVQRTSDWLLIIAFGIPLLLGYVHNMFHLSKMCVPGVPDKDGSFPCGDTRDPSLGYPESSSQVSTDLSAILSLVLYFILIIVNALTICFCNNCKQVDVTNNNDIDNQRKDYNYNRSCKIYTNKQVEMEPIKQSQGKTHAIEDDHDIDHSNFNVSSGNNIDCKVNINIGKNVQIQRSSTGSDHESSNINPSNNSSSNLKCMIISKQWKIWLHYTDIMLRIYLIISILCVYVTQIMKKYVGSPRPNFYINYDADTKVDQAYMSFPSGHAAEAFGPMIVPTLFFVDVINYVEKCTFVKKDCIVTTHNSIANTGCNWFLLPLWRLLRNVSLLSYLIALIPLYVASWISLTRAKDYKHHLIDCVAGALIGSVVGYFFGYKKYYYQLMGVPVHCGVNYKPIIASETQNTAAQQVNGKKNRINDDERLCHDIVSVPKPKAARLKQKHDANGQSSRRHPMST